jgi:hypothetical protein
MTLEQLAWYLMVIAGISQLILIVGSLAIPKVLGWAEQLASQKTLMRQMFWTYAAYIWAINLCFGLISTFGPSLLLDRSPLAACVTGFITLYWLARVLIQFTYFDTSELPNSPFHNACAWLLDLLFIALTAVYGLAFLLNLKFIQSQ